MEHETWKGDPVMNHGSCRASSHYVIAKVLCLTQVASRNSTSHCKESLINQLFIILYLQKGGQMLMGLNARLDVWYVGEMEEEA